MFYDDGQVGATYYYVATCGKGKDVRPEMLFNVLESTGIRNEGHPRYLVMVSTFLKCDSKFETEVVDLFLIS